MMTLERLWIELLLHFVAREELNLFLRSPQNTATLVGCLIAVSGALLGAFLLLRGMSLTSDAISHTVLLGIVVAFLLMTDVFGLEGDTSSPWLIIGAALAGVATVALTELLYHSGLVRQDAALGLAFPLSSLLRSSWSRALPKTSIWMKIRSWSEKSGWLGPIPITTALKTAGRCRLTRITRLPKSPANAPTAVSWASARATKAPNLPKSASTAANTPRRRLGRLD